MKHVVEYRVLSCFLYAYGCLAKQALSGPYAQFAGDQLAKVAHAVGQRSLHGAADSHPAVPVKRLVKLFHQTVVSWSIVVRDTRRTWAAFRGGCRCTQDPGSRMLSNAVVCCRISAAAVRRCCSNPARWPTFRVRQNWQAALVLVFIAASRVGNVCTMWLGFRGCFGLRMKMRGTTQPAAVT